VAGALRKPKLILLNCHNPLPGMEKAVFALSSFCNFHIPIRTLFKHLENLNQVLDCLKRANLKLSPQKCDLFKDRVVFLDHVVSADDTTTDPVKIESVTNWPIPKNVRQVRSFFGLCSYHRRYVRNFADIARPLHKLTEKNVKFEWTDSCQESFDTLKRALTTAPILGYPLTFRVFELK
jgi:hypothetical protein